MELMIRLQFYLRHEDYVYTYFGLKRAGKPNNKICFIRNIET